MEASGYQNDRTSKNEEQHLQSNYHGRSRSTNVPGDRNNYSYDINPSEQQNDMVNNQQFKQHPQQQFYHNPNYQFASNGRNSKQTGSSFNNINVNSNTEGIFGASTSQKYNATNSIPYVSDIEQHSHLKAATLNPPIFQKQNSDNTNFISEYYQNKNARIGSAFDINQMHQTPQNSAPGAKLVTDFEQHLPMINNTSSEDRKSDYGSILNQQNRPFQPSPARRKIDPQFHSPLANPISGAKKVGSRNSHQKETTIIAGVGVLQQNAKSYQIADRQQSQKNYQNIQQKKLERNNSANSEQKSEEQNLSMNKSQKMTPQLSKNLTTESIPLGCFDGILFLAQVSQGRKVSIKIPETIISGGHFETKIIYNKAKLNQAPSFTQNVGGASPSHLKPPKGNSQEHLHSSKLAHKDLEQTLCTWLQQNIEKSKQGSFVPITIKKFKQNKNAKVETNLDFFVAAGMQSFNEGLKQTKGSILGGDVFIMQRYVPSKEESPQIYRVMWIKNKGYKFYKFTSVYPYNGQQEQIAQPMNQDSQQQSSSGEHRENVPRPESRNSPQNENIKLLTFNDLADQYKKIQKMGNQRQQILSQIVDNNTQMIGSGNGGNREVPIDLTSLKNQQHIILQKEIASNFSVVHQFQVLDKNKKTFISDKIAPTITDNKKIIDQTTTQMSELIKLLNDAQLKGEGLQLQQIVVDFIEDYQDSTLYFLQIESFQIEPLPEQKTQTNQALNYSIQHRKVISNQIFNDNHHFKCHGDYCYIKDQSYVPRHLAPIVAKIQKYEVPQVPKKTVDLERELIKDDYRAYKQSKVQFRTMVEQELLLRRSLNSNEQVDVCPTCFFIYNFIQDKYYENSKGGTDDEGTIDSSKEEPKLSRADQKYIDQIIKSHHGQMHQQQLQQYLNDYTNAPILSKPQTSYAFSRGGSKSVGGVNLPPIQKTSQHPNYPFRGTQEKVQHNHSNSRAKNEEIKEDYIAENRESLEYDHELNDNDQGEEEEDDDIQVRDDYGEDEDEDDFNDERDEEQYQQYSGQLSHHSPEVKSQSRFNIGISETSPGTLNNRESDFKMPSDVFQTNKQTFVTNFSNQSAGPNYHFRTESNASQQEQLRINASKQRLKDIESQGRAQITIDTNDPSQQKTFQDSEYNPPLKYPIKAKVLPKIQLKQQDKGLNVLRHMPTSTFGEQSHITNRTLNNGSVMEGQIVNETAESKGKINNLRESCKIQTFGVMEIIQRIKKRNSTLSQASSSQNMNTSPMEKSNQAEKGKIEEGKTINQSFKISQFNERSRSNLVTPPILPQSNSTMQSFKDSPKLEQQLTIVSIKSSQKKMPKIPIGNQSEKTSVQKARDYLKAQDIDCQVGESLAQFPKPPKSSKEIQIKEENHQNHRDYRDYIYQEVDLKKHDSHSYLETQSILKKLTSENTNSPQQLITQPKNFHRNQDIQKKYATQDIQLPSIRNTPDPDLPNISLNQAPTSIHQYEPSELQVPKQRTQDPTLSHNSGRSSSTQKKLNSSLRLRSHSLREQNQQIYQALQDSAAQVPSQPPLLSQMFERHESKEANNSNKVVNVTGGHIEEPEILKEKTKTLSKKLKLELPGKSNELQSIQSLKKSESTYNNKQQDPVEENKIENGLEDDEKKSRNNNLDLTQEELKIENELDSPIKLELHHSENEKVVRDGQDNDDIQSLQYQVIDPKSPPKILLAFQSSPMDNKTPSRMNVSDSHTTKKVDSFFGQQSQIEDEFMVDYIMPGDEDSTSLILMSNPQMRQIVSRRTNGLGGMSGGGNAGFIFNSGSKQSLYQYKNTLPIIHSTRRSLENNNNEEENAEKDQQNC